MKHIISVFVFGLFLGVIGLTDLRAQEHPGSLVLLSSIENVRKELKLTSLQEAVLKSIRQDYKNDARKIVGGPLETKQERRNALSQLNALDDRYNRRILSTLSSKQMETLRAIEHRVLGGYMLTDATIQNALGLTHQQKEKIAATQKRFRIYVDEINKKFERGTIDQFDRLRLLKAYRKSTADKMEKVLTKSQLVEFKKMEKAK